MNPSKPRQVIYFNYWYVMEAPSWLKDPVVNSQYGADLEVPCLVVVT